jgi:hypothetical protein
MDTTPTPNISTHNIISTPNIEGNIGTCTSNKIQVSGKRNNIWTEEVTSIVTNSCTGHVDKYISWGLTEFTGFMMFSLMVVIVGSFFVFYLLKRNDY